MTVKTQKSKSVARTKARRKRTFLRPAIFLTLWILVHLGFRLSEAWTGIPKIKVSRLGTELSAGLSMNETMTEYADEVAEYPSDYEPEEIEIATGDEDFQDEESWEVSDDDIFSDLEKEWKTFDDQWSDRSRQAEDGVDKENGWEAAFLVHSLKEFAWPLSLLAGIIILFALILIAICKARKQIFCCGKPCYDSSLEAASNYDRVEMRREKIKMIKKNPLATRRLEDTEMQGIATFLKGGTMDSVLCSASRKDEKTEFMDEYNLRFGRASFRHLEPHLARNTVPKIGRDPEYFVVRVPPRRIEADIHNNEYDEVHDVAVQEV